MLTTASLPADCGAAGGWRAGSAAVLAAVLLAAGLPTAAQAQARRPALAAAAAGSTITLPGLAAPAQILVDRWGVPHIYAGSTDDVYLVQGFNAARDRLFQIDLWRRRGLGRLASIFGANFVEQDRAARLFLYRGDMRREWAAYGPDAERIAGRFVAGINAYIDLVARDPTLLPQEFRQFAYQPEKWQPDDVVRIRSHGLTRNVLSEFWRAQMACRADLKSDLLRSPLTPAWETKLPEGLDPCVPPEALRAFVLATQGVVVTGRDGKRADAAPHAVPGSSLRLAADATQRAPEGSNAWVIAPARSATGRPILASDPHRGHSAPSLRYIVHLNAPGLNVIGGGEPALPGVSIGHNGKVAFGLTIFAIDQEDLLVYDTNPANPLEYRYKGQWERMQTAAETIAVQGRPSTTTELQFTRHGPVTWIDRSRNRAYAVRTVWTEPGTAPYLGSIHYMQANNVDDFRRAMAHWGAPSANQLVADVQGNIGWVAGGLAPVRPNWDGLLPVPGDGRYEWAGFWPGDKLPSASNPAQGWLASANEMNLPADYPYRERKLGFEWPQRARYQRIAEVLDAPGKRSVDDSLRLQNDLLSLPARRLQAVLNTVAPADPRARAAVQLLLGWNAQVSGDSAAAALFELWWSRHLGVLFKDSVLPRPAAALLRSAEPEVLLDAMEKPAALLGTDAVAKRDDIIEKSLLLAWADLQKLQGPDPATWRWNKLHHVLFPHVLANATDAATASKLNVGPLPQQGGGHTVNVTPYDPADFRQTAGASFRIVIDVGNWDNARAMNTPGQSGDSASPHYRDLAPLWLKGSSFPLLYSRPKVEAALERRIDLVPANPTLRTR